MTSDMKTCYNYISLLVNYIIINTKCILIDIRYVFSFRISLSYYLCIRHVNK